MMSWLVFVLLLVVTVVNSQTTNIVYANDDKAHCYENGSVVIPVINNDFGLSEGVGELAISVIPAFGHVLVNTDNSITYTPKESFFGHDELTYKVCNNSGACDQAIVRIEVYDVDFIPGANNDTIRYVHESEYLIKILDNDIINGDKPVQVNILDNVNNGFCEITENNELIPEFSRKYIGKDSLVYEVCDKDGDCSTAKVIFEIVHEGSIDFYIPNAMSPNGDGLNDTFRVPDFTNYSGISARIVDRWGNLVYEHQDYPNDWDGKANTGRLKGQLVPTGTYYYFFQVPGVGEQLTGYVYITK